jgi:hypothetical protein
MPTVPSSAAQAPLRTQRLLTQLPLAQIVFGGQLSTQSAEGVGSKQAPLAQIPESQVEPQAPQFCGSCDISTQRFPQQDPPRALEPKGQMVPSAELSQLAGMHRMEK